MPTINTCKIEDYVGFVYLHSNTWVEFWAKDNEIRCGAIGNSLGNILVVSLKTIGNMVGKQSQTPLAPKEKKKKKGAHMSVHVEPLAT